MAIQQAQWTSSLRRAHHALIALVLWNSLGSTTLWVYGVKEGPCDWLATVQLTPGHLTRVSIWTKADESYAADGPSMSTSTPASPMLLVDLWDQNTTGHRLTHLAGVTLSQRLLAWFAVSATVAPLGLLVLLTWIQHRGQHASVERYR